MAQAQVLDDLARDVVKKLKEILIARLEFLAREKIPCSVPVTALGKRKAGVWELKLW